MIEYNTILQTYNTRLKLLLNTIDELFENGSNESIIIDDVSKSIVERTSIEINDERIKSIRSYAFYNCTRLATVSFPECTNISDYAFANCTRLATVSFPECTDIGFNAFDNCINLTTVSFPECTSIGYEAFYNCTNLTTVSFPVCTNIGSFAFYLCTNLTSVSFPVCTIIGQNAFTNCTNLTSVSFPVCTTIGAEAFHTCIKLSALILANSTICKLNNSNALSRTKIASKTGYIYVPRSLVSNYQTATNWTYFSTQISAIEDSEYWDDSDMGGGDEGDENTNLIEFTIDGVSYQAEEGMTWAEWINSSYTNDLIPAIIYGQLYLNGYALVYYSGEYVYVSDFIIAEHQYGTK